MKIAEPENKKSQSRNTKAFIISGGFHLVLLISFYYLMFLQPPNPPWGDLGVSVNFGFGDEGFGEVQSMDNPGGGAASNMNTAESSNSQTTESNTSESSQDLNTGFEDSPVEAPPAKGNTQAKDIKETKTNAKPSNSSSANASSSSSSSAKPNLDYNTGDGAGKGSSEGNKAGTSGNMGRTGGDLKSLNYDGNPGNGNGSGKGSGSGGASLDLAGWTWDSKPVIKDESNEDGKIVFQIIVDEEGELIGVRVLEKTVSPAVVAKYQREVEKLTFVKKTSGQTSGNAMGKITFIIKNL